MGGTCRTRGEAICTQSFCEKPEGKRPDIDVRETLICCITVRCCIWIQNKYIVTISQVLYSRWKFTTLTVQYTTLDYSSHLF
jgi:hypothetical protein